MSQIKQNKTSNYDQYHLHILIVIIIQLRLLLEVFGLR